jgi:hypothetical protein
MFFLLRGAICLTMCVGLRRIDGSEVVQLGPEAGTQVRRPPPTR